MFILNQLELGSLAEVYVTMYIAYFDQKSIRIFCITANLFRIQKKKSRSESLSTPQLGSADKKNESVVVLFIDWFGQLALYLPEYRAPEQAEENPVVVL